MQLPTLPDCSRTTQVSPYTQVGGVSNGHDGAAMMELQSHNLYSVRSWAMLQSALVATVAKADCNSSHPVVLTLADRIQTSAVTLASQGSVQTLSPGAIVVPSSQVDWVHHGNTVYYLLPSASGQVSIFNGNSSGDWGSIGVTERNQTVLRFSLKLNLTLPVTNAELGYVVLPAVSLADAADAVKAFQAELQLTLSATAGTATYGHGHLALATMLSGGVAALNSSFTLVCSDTCMLVLEQTGNSTWSLAVSSTRPRVTVTLPSHVSCASNGSEEATQGRTEAGVVVVLPDGDFQGQTVMLKCIASTN